MGIGTVPPPQGGQVTEAPRTHQSPGPVRDGVLGVSISLCISLLLGLPPLQDGAVLSPPRVPGPHRADAAYLLGALTFGQERSGVSELKELVNLRTT